MKMISLYTGIGGIDLGAERAGIETIIQVENSPFCTAILEKHWPKCKRYLDIKDMNLYWLRADFPARTQAKPITTAKESTDPEPAKDGARCTELYANKNYFNL